MSISMNFGMSCTKLQSRTVITGASRAPLRPVFRTSPLSVTPISRADQRRGFAVRATGNEVDFDSILNNIADKFEKSDNKAAIIGYSAAAIGALWASEWLIHLPLFNFLLGFPIQLLGLVLLPYFSVKYLVDKDNATDDASKAFDRVVKKLPGLDK